MLNRLSLHAVVPAMLSVLIVSPAVLGNIYQWEWVDPADHSQGRQASSTLSPDGAGLVPQPGLDAYNKNLTQAWLSGTNLTDAYFDEATLTDADFTGANLTYIYVRDATLTNADFTDATIAGANFSGTTDSGFTQAQFESTANYVSGDLAGINFGYNDMSSWNFAGKNLTHASFGSATLTNAVFTQSNLAEAFLSSATLTDANLTEANFTHADFGSATLTNADFTGATIDRASFSNTTGSGYTQMQFESTATYASGNLAGMNLRSNDLSSWNFTNMDLTGASFVYTTLTDTDFTGATIAGADFRWTKAGTFTYTQFESTASYASGDLTGVLLDQNDLSSWNFAHMDITDASFSGATLTNSDFTDATIAGANFSGTTDSGFTQAQFESTASYVSGELAWVSLSANDLSSWNFAGKNLAGADFDEAKLIEADLARANLTDAYFGGAKLTDADLTGADARGAGYMRYDFAAILDNFVQPNGQVPDGLNIEANEQFRVWDYDGQDTNYDGEPDILIDILVLNRFVIDDAGLLIVGLEDDVWGSTIDFDRGISVILDGTLEVELRNGFMPSVGDQWQLFDFAGVTPTGAFDTFVLPTLAGGMQWDTSDLMNTGVISVVVPEPTSLLVLVGALAGTTIRRSH